MLTKVPAPQGGGGHASLLELLDQMQAAVLGGGGVLPLALADRLLGGRIDGFGAAERLHVYRHAYRARLVEALRETFGHCARYLDSQFDGKGDSAFDRLATAYVETHPSLERNINAYGSEWPQWLAEHLPKWPEVAELASLDWHLRRAFDGPNARALQLADLAGFIGRADWPQMPLHLVPTYTRLQFATNALALWHAIDQDQAPPDACVLPENMDLMVWRVGHQPHFRSVGRFEAQALDALAAGGSFGAMCEQLCELLCEPASDQAQDEGELAASAGALLRRWVDEALLSSED